MSNITAEIYSIKDPRTEETIYIGSTRDMVLRKYNHCLRSSKSKISSKIFEIQDDGHEPIFTIIDSCNWLRQFEVERKWIHYYFTIGEPLINRKISDRTAAYMNEKYPLTMLIDAKLLLEINADEENLKDGLVSYIENLLINSIKSTKI